MLEDGKGKGLQPVARGVAAVGRLPERVTEAVRVTRQGKRGVLNGVKGQLDASSLSPVLPSVLNLSG